MCSNRAINLCLLLGIPSPTILYFIVHEGIGFFHHTTLPSSTNALPKKPKPTSFKDLLTVKHPLNHTSRRPSGVLSISTIDIFAKLAKYCDMASPCKCCNLLSVQYHPVRLTFHRSAESTLKNPRNHTLFFTCENKDKHL